MESLKECSAKSKMELPLPYNNELWYSVIARYQSYFKINSRRLLLELYGDAACCAIVDLPVRIKNVFQRTYLLQYMKVEEVLFNHTLFPFYTAFLDDGRRKRIENEMLFGENGQGYSCFYLFDRSSRFPDLLFYCPLCVEEESEQLGEAYWHREHQIPGVGICLRHKIILETGCPGCLRSFVRGDHRFINLNSICSCGRPLFLNYRENIQNYTWEHTIEFASDVDVLLNSSPMLEPRKLQTVFHDRLKLLSLATSRGNVRTAKLVQAIVDYYGNDFLNAVGYPIDLSSGSCWVIDMLREREETIHPTKYILLIRFLFGSFYEFLHSETEEYLPFGRGPWPCLNRASEHYGQPLAQLICLKKHRTKRPFGVFKCDCGFVYERVGPDEFEEDRFKYNYVLCYGEVWHQRLKNMDEQGLTQRQMVERLNVSVPTIYTQLQKMRRGVSIDEGSLWASDNFNKLRREYRSRVEDIIRHEPTIARSRIERAAKKECAWLYQWDREWIELIFPPRLQRIYNIKQT